MDNNQGHVLGTIELEKHHVNLINKFAEAILEGTVEQAVETFEVIFEREPKDEVEMMIFKALCEQVITEQNGGNLGIQGVIDGGRKQSH